MRTRFQCSSASRKFLKSNRADNSPGASRFSALQRAENSSKRRRRARARHAAAVSVLFSEPKIPQSWGSRCAKTFAGVSVLFSEPKIPQIPQVGTRIVATIVSVLFSEPKIPQIQPALRLRFCKRFVSVLFSEPKIPQTYINRPSRTDQPPFQCSSASRKFLKGYGFPPLRSPAPVSVLFSEPKIPQSLDARQIDGCVTSFSALQRAENSSNRRAGVRQRDDRGFQCSSASRKFLKPPLL